MSEVKVNKISPRSGTDVTLGDASDTFTIPASATLDVNGTLDLAGSTMTGFTIPSGQTLTVASGGTITNSGTATGFGGTNTPSFEAYQSTTMASVAHGVTTKVDIDTVIFETTGGDFDTTNNRWTVPSGEGGKYLIFCQVIPDGGAYTNLNYVSVWIYLNGVAYIKSYDHWGNVYTRLHTLDITTVMELSAADYLEVFVNLSTTNGSAGAIYASSPKMGHFGGFKLL